MAICIKTSDDSRRTFIFRMFDTSGKASVADINQHFADPEMPPSVEAMWAFDKLHDKEIGMKKGEIATLVSKYNSSWWVIQNSQGEVGYVASSYLKEIESTKAGLLSIPQDSAGRITLDQFQKWAQNSEPIRLFCNTLKNFTVQPPPAVELGGPTNFRHTTHIGLDSLPDWNALLAQANILPEEVADPQTALFLLTVIKEERDKQIAGVSNPPSVPPPQDIPNVPQNFPETNDNPPEPQQVPVPSDVPPPPSDEVSPSSQQETTPAAPPPPQPPQPQASIPKPPPRPQKRNEEKMPEPSMFNLLEEIKNPKKKLKTVTASDINLNNLTQSETNDLVGILKKAMSMRRADVAGWNNKIADDDEEEWQ
jgi:hypothetical protein